MIGAGSSSRNWIERITCPRLCKSRSAIQTFTLLTISVRQCLLERNLQVATIFVTVEAAFLINVQISVGLMMLVSMNMPATADWICGHEHERARQFFSEMFQQRIPVWFKVWIRDNLHKSLREPCDSRLLHFITPQKRGEPQW